MSPRRRPRRRDSDNADRVEVGQLLRQRAMGTDALYRVVEKTEHGVRVEVVEVPGLQPGAQFLFSDLAVAGMEVLYASPERQPTSATSSVVRHRLV